YTPGVTPAGGTEAYLVAAGAAGGVGGGRGGGPAGQALGNAGGGEPRGGVRGGGAELGHAAADARQRCAGLPASRVQEGVRGRVPRRSGPGPPGTGKVREQVRRAHHRDPAGPGRLVGVDSHT